MTEIAIPNNDHRSYQNPSTWIPLFEIDTGDEIQYLTPGNVSQVVEGVTYKPFPIMMDEISQDDKGTMNTVKLVCSDIEGVIGTGLKRTGSIDGNDVIFKVYSIEAEEIMFEEVLQIIHCGPVSNGTVTFELGMFNPYIVKLLQEKYYTDFCWNRYKKKGCWIKQIDGTFVSPADFIIDDDLCNHNLEDCVRHNNVLRINTFPGIPGSGGYV
jgi:phage-related protein